KNAKKKRKVIHVDDEDPGQKPTQRKPSVADSIGGDIATLWKQTKHPGVKDLCSRLLKPHDVIVARYTTSTTNEVLHVEPIQNHYEPDPKLDRPLVVVPYSTKWEELKKRELQPTVVKSFTPYEDYAQAQVDEFLQGHWEDLPADKGSYL